MLNQNSIRTSQFPFATSFRFPCAHAPSSLCPPTSCYPPERFIKLRLFAWRALPLALAQGNQSNKRTCNRAGAEQEGAGGGRGYKEWVLPLLICKVASFIGFTWVALGLLHVNRKLLYIYHWFVHFPCVWVILDMNIEVVYSMQPYYMHCLLLLLSDKISAKRFFVFIIEYCTLV